MAIDVITRQPLLAIYWIILFFLNSLVFNNYPKLIPFIKKLIVIFFILCIISSLIFILPNYTNSYMQQHFLNGAHNIKFGLYDFKDMHSGFYGPLAYWLFSWWSTSLPFSISFAKGFLFILFVINSFITIKLMPKASNYLRLTVIFLMAIQAYYFYLGVQQFIIFLSLIIYNFGYKNIRDGFFQKNSFKLINILISCFSTIFLFLLKPHLIVYGLLSIPLFFRLKENKSWFYSIRLKYINCWFFLLSFFSFFWLCEKFLKFSTFKYLEFLKIPAGHSVNFEYFLGLIVLNIFLIYTHWLVRSKVQKSNDINLFFTIPIILVSLPLIYASSKHGSDLTHILPLWTLIITDTLNTFSLLKDKKSILKEFSYIKVLLVSFPLFFLPLSIESYGSTYKWYLKIDSAPIKKDIDYIKNKYTCQDAIKIKSKFKSCVSFGMGYGKDSLDKILYLSPLITSQNNYNLVDISMVRDKFDSGYPPYFKEILSGKEVAFFIIPKGDEPFSMGNDIYMGSQLEPMIGQEGINYFKQNYKFIESTNLYDIYKSNYI